MLAMLGCALRANDLDLGVALWDIIKRDAARLMVRSPSRSLAPQTARTPKRLPSGQTPAMRYLQALVEEEVIESEQQAQHAVLAEEEGSEAGPEEADQEAFVEAPMRIPHAIEYQAMIAVYGKHGRWQYVGCRC